MSRSTSRGGRDIAGVIALAVGAGIIALGSGFFPKAMVDAHAPLWVVLVAGGVFSLAGVIILLQGRSPDWVPALFTNLLLTLFAIIPAWIAWGGSRQGFSASIESFGGFLRFGIESGVRIAFAVSAVIMTLIAIAAWWSWLARLSRTARFGMLATAISLAYLALVVAPAEPRWPDVADDHERLARYALVSDQEGWTHNAGGEPLRWYFPPWRNFEEWTKAARGRLAAARTVPPGQEVLIIPLSGTVPVIDGTIDDEEWRGALHIPLESPALASSARIVSDGRFLYLASDVPADTTAKGYDQFRFWFHIRLSPWLDNERVFVDRAGSVSALRGTRFPWEPGKPRSRTDWRIYEQAHGAASMDGHRRFELALNLAESGIAPGVPFPAWIEIEGDPLLTAAGKFKARTIMGQAGSHASPLWLRVDRR